jgi:DNA-binding transcriptional LysR family regulator
MATVFTLVESGLCVSIVPRCVASLKRPLVVRSVIPKSAQIPLCIVWRKSSDNPAVLAFLEILRASRPAIRKQLGKMIRQSNEAA